LALKRAISSAIFTARNQDKFFAAPKRQFVDTEQAFTPSGTKPAEYDAAVKKLFAGF
jgi:hypothetical protein